MPSSSLKESYRTTTTKAKGRKAQKHNHPHHHIIHVTAPPTPLEEERIKPTWMKVSTTTPLEEERIKPTWMKVSTTTPLEEERMKPTSMKVSTTTPLEEERIKPTSMVVSLAAVYMEVPEEWEKRREDGREGSQVVVAQIERVGGTGTARVTTETTTPTIPTITTTSAIATTVPTTTMPKSVESTTAKRASTTEREPKESGLDVDEEEDLFWMRGDDGRNADTRPTDSVRVMPSPNVSLVSLSAAAMPSSSKAQSVPEAKRPTIQFGPMNAMEVAGKTRDRELEKEEQVREELNEIIASVERDGVSPVEIPFDPVEWPSIPVPEPVWRRPPPDETAALIPPLPQKTPSTPAIKQIDAHMTYEQPMHVKAKLDRKRREAPVMVTALLDIGRGKWQRFTRHFDQYLGYLANIVLRLQNRLIIYCNSSVTSYLHSLGDRIDWERIQVVEMSLQELPYYKYRDEVIGTVPQQESDPPPPQIEEIMRWEQEHWHNDWDKQMQSHPETLYPDYDILVNSKPYFLVNATKISRFSKPPIGGQQFFVWLDAGYGHGSISEIPRGVWSPMLKAGKITVVQLTSKMERVERYSLDKVYRKQKSVVSGGEKRTFLACPCSDLSGFLAGPPEAINRFHTFFHLSFMEMLDARMVDDDQTTLLVTIQKFRSTFNIIFGGWFDAFKLLPSQ
uniref:Reverse transcriptase domain-containing protein n=1 Tax=Globodera pallida TaxID=36090 RepID=A0A183BUQ5_GLOPA